MVLGMGTKHICFEECTFVIFGVSGDLSKRKLIPAIYKLIEDGKLCKFNIVGVSFENTTVKKLLEQSKRFFKKSDLSIWEKLEKSFQFYKMDFHDEQGYEGLLHCLVEGEKKKGLVGNRLFYFATMPDHFVVITKNLDKSGFLHKNKSVKNENQVPWARVVYEKPFGGDLHSSRQINRCLARVFSENQIYRIDHYLGKELVGNIVMTRFTNRIFEPLWNNKHIDSVQIISSEKIGIEGRGQYYDSYGALKDMVQSHLLQLLALIAMERPKALQAPYIRNAKFNILKKVFVNSVVLGQYEGYSKERGVAKNSKTETFAALKLGIKNRRWAGVPFYIKTGKFLAKKEISIHIKFKMVKCLLTKCPSDSNYLTIRISSNEGIFLELNSKVPGEQDNVTPVTMEFCHSTLFGPNTPAAYENLFADVIKGDRSTFLRSDEVEASWKIIEQVKKIGGKVHSYSVGGVGPRELVKLDKKRKIRWRA